MPRYPPVHLRCFHPSCFRDSEGAWLGVRRSVLCFEHLDVVLQAHGNMNRSSERLLSWSR
ncbi:unnamed protein product [Ectocarpus sp. 4 AP-2014]